MGFAGAMAIVGGDGIGFFGGPPGVAIGLGLNAVGIYLDAKGTVAVAKGAALAIQASKQSRPPTLDLMAKATKPESSAKCPGPKPPAGKNASPPRFDGPKPKYVVNPAHDPRSPLPKKTPIPPDAADVFANAVPDDPVKPRNWFGMNRSGQIYRFSGSREGTVHFSGTEGIGDGLRNITDYALRRLGKK